MFTDDHGIAIHSVGNAYQDPEIHFILKIISHVLEVVQWSKGLQTVTVRRGWSDRLQRQLLSCFRICIGC